MKTPLSPLRYAAPSIALHWLMALVILAALAVGFVMDDLPMPQKFTVIQLHKSVGLLVLVLLAVRLVFRAVYKAPGLPVGTPKWQVALAHATHAGLYVLMLGVPLLGWLMSDAKGYHPAFFGANIVPVLTGQNEALADILKEAHEVGATLILLLVGLHVAGAVYHRVIAKDGLAERMLPLWLVRLLPAVVLACVALPAVAQAPAAAAWQVDSQASQIVWTARFNGAAVSGKFADWKADIAFDPANLNASRIEVHIALASVSSGDSNRDDTLKGGDFFNVAQSPEAVFTSAHIKPVGQAGEGRYVAVGNLTLAGQTKPFALPFQVRLNGNAASATADFTLSRNAFGVGKGQWKNDASIADLVNVHVAVQATK